MKEPNDPASAAVQEEDFLIQTGVLVSYQGNAKAVTVPAHVTSIGEKAFEGRKRLSSLSLPSSLTSIGEKAFSRCERLSSLSLPAALTRIGDKAFSGCWSLSSLSLPEGLTCIGNKAFENCKSLTAIEVDRANRVYASKEGVLFNRAFTELIAYPEGKKLARYAVPAAVTKIGDRAFSGCKRLSAISLSAQTPPELGSEAFPSGARIYVPSASVKAYQSAPGWEDYRDRILPLG